LKQEVKMKKLVSFIICCLIAVISGCTTPYSYQGGAAGAGVGGVAGAMLDSKNPWRGAVKGALLGGVLGASLTEVSARAAREAAVYNKPVRYVSKDRRRMYLAEPVGFNGETKCRKVRERLWDEGRLTKDRVREVCTGNRTEQWY
jgi:hypothetical protein